MQEKIHCFEPFIDSSSRVLILGSMPSVRSLDEGFYYMHPQNRFYRVISSLAGADLPESLEEKKQLLKKHGIALFDVIASCHREGSTDAKIKDAVPNDIDSLLKSYKNIELVVTNGKLAEKLYKKHNNNSLPHIALPSTSPIPRRDIRNFEDLLSRWEELRSYLNSR